jgi:hypothetical protein
MSGIAFAPEPRDCSDVTVTSSDGVTFLLHSQFLRNKSKVRKGNWRREWTRPRNVVGQGGQRAREGCWWRWGWG